MSPRLIFNFLYLWYSFLILSSCKLSVRLRELIESLEKNQLQLKSTIAETNRILAEAQEKQFAMQDKRMQGIEAQFTAFTAAVQSRLETLQKDNSEQLEKMRVTVDEKCFGI